MLIFRAVDVVLPDHYGTGIIFLEESTASRTKGLFEQLANKVGFHILTWRKIRVNSSVLSKSGLDSEPLMEQVFLTPNFAIGADGSELTKRLYILKKMASLQIGTLEARFYICSLCSKTIVYKGQFTPHQLWDYFEDFKVSELKTT